MLQAVSTSLSAMAIVRPESLPCQGQTTTYCALSLGQQQYIAVIVTTPQPRLPVTNAHVSNDLGLSSAPGPRRRLRRVHEGHEARHKALQGSCSERIRFANHTSNG